MAGILILLLLAVVSKGFRSLMGALVSLAFGFLLLLVGSAIL